MSILDLDKTPEEFAEQKAIRNQADTILSASAISILFCCLGGIVATYFAYQGKQEANAGNIESAKHNIKIAKWCMIGAFIIGVLAILGKIADRR